MLQKQTPIFISFLDTTVKIDDLGSISTSLYRKPTAANSILRAESSHPKASLRSIPFVQYLQIKRICSDSDDFKCQARALQNRLFLRGYSRSLLKKAYNHALKQDRQSLPYYLYYLDCRFPFKPSPPCWPSFGCNHGLFTIIASCLIKRLGYASLSKHWGRQMMSPRLVTRLHHARRVAWCWWEGVCASFGSLSCHSSSGRV